MRSFVLILVGTVCVAGSVVAVPVSATKRLNLLIITVDDMSADSLGAFRCPLDGTSPNIDRLASEGLKFTKAHVQVGNCMPSRNVMWSGRYPHNNGVEGFYQVKNATHPHLCDVLQRAGYFAAIRHKVSHSTPYTPYRWDLDLDQAPDGQKAHMKDPASYGISTRQGIDAARAAGKPFCLVMNIADPHKPFYAEGNKGQTITDPYVPSRVFTPEEVPIPGFLFDDPIVRKELAHYYSSVRRADDGVGAILKALDDAGCRENTLVMFLSDHGMPLPFAKTQLYHHSTHTPLIFRVPGITTPNTVDETHMVSAVDFLPTLLEVLQVDAPADMDGRSFAPLLSRQPQDGRTMVFKEYNENAGGSRDPMRGVQTARYLYLFNPWSNGERVMATATSGTPTYRRMAELARSDRGIAYRHDLYQHRVVEELFDVERDPDCLVNLIDSPDHQAELHRLRVSLEQWMFDTGDHMLPVFRDRENPETREAYVLEKEREAAARRGEKNRNKGTDATRVQPVEKRKRDIISIVVPPQVEAGSSVTVTIPYDLPPALGEQQLHVTFKRGDQGARLDRKVVTISGAGSQTLVFDVPAELPEGNISFAAFVGVDFQHNLQHVRSSASKLTMPMRAN